MEVTKEEEKKRPSSFFKKEPPKAPAVPYQQPYTAVPYHQLFSFADPSDWLLMLLGSAGAVVHGAAMPVLLFFLGRLINSLAEGDTGAVPGICLYFVYLGFSVWFGAWLEVSCWMTAGERQAARIREQYMAALLKQDVAFFDTGASGGEIVSRISSDMALIQDAISERVGNFLHFFASFVAGFAVGFSSIWQLSLVTLAVMPLIALAGGVYAAHLSGLTSRNQEAYAHAGTIAEQAISQVRTVYSFAAEDLTVAKYTAALDTSLKIGIQGGLSKGLGMGGIFGVLFCTWALLFWYSGRLVEQGTTNGGEALATMFSVIIGALSLGNAMTNIQVFASGRAAAQTVFSTMSRKPQIDAGDESGLRLDQSKGDVELRDVAFTYPTRPDVLVLQGLSLKVVAGQAVALVGGSGSGKSTVIAVLERFYDPTGGAVLFDGHDIRTLNLKWLRSRMGLVSQEPALFDTSIKNNVMYGREGATMEEVEAACKASNIHDFIASLPHGYDTQVGERGSQLSGGQKQRIAIARAILRNPAVLLLDEATSALDTESERVVQEALEVVMKGRTSIVVAHRLSTIRKSSSIAVVSGGRIVEQGTHEELMELGEAGSSGGEYASLVRMQSLSDGGKDERPAGTSTSLLKETIYNVAHETCAPDVTKSGSSEQASLGKDPETARTSTEETNKGTWLRLFRLSLPELPFTALACTGAACAGCINPLFANFLISVIAAFYNPDLEAMRQEVAKWSLVMVGLAVASLLANIIQHYFFGFSGEHLVKRVRQMMFSAILRNEVAWFDRPENSSGAVASRLSNDSTLVKAAITDRFSVLAQNTSLIAVAFAISFSLCWRVTLVILATFPLLIIGSAAQQMFLKGFAGDQESAHQSASIIASEAVSNIRTVAALHLEDRVLALFQAQLRGPLKQTVVRGQLSGFVFGFTQFLMFSSFALGLWYGSTLIPEYASTENVLKAFMIIVFTSLTIAEILTLAPDLAKGGVAILSVFNILDRMPEMDQSGDGKGEKADDIAGAIELKNVKFSYPMRPHVCVFDDLSLQVPQGKTVALVGASGSGKSTVLALVERFYDPISGMVTIDGKDIKSFNIHTLRSRIGYVSQEPALFATTIRENILYGNRDASEAEVIEAAKAANVYSFVSGLPDGFDTQVGERGAQLSGGQKQRIALARTVLKNPSILLLDEATSALDAESEATVQEAINNLMVGRSTVTVAHRLSTIAKADIIAVFQQGSKVEQGSHEELVLNKHGAYSRLLSMQNF